jgi:hypothetical protein
MTQLFRVERGVLVCWALALLVAAGLAIAPLWLWGVPLRWHFLRLDDFVYLSRSRTADVLARCLFVPHNAHVVPLFLVETHFLARWAGSLAAVPDVLGWAGYATLLLAMATAGHLVAWETGRAERGLIAMAAVGLSSVLGPAVLWYAAGQALAAGTMILAMLAALQAWRARGSWWLLACGLVAAVAAPLFWSAGYTAGPAGAAYLWADGRRRCRRAAILPLAGALATAIGMGMLVRSSIAPAPRLGSAVWSVLDRDRLESAAAHTAQAVCEALVLNNLGVDASTTPGQALVLLALLAGFWVRSHRQSGPAGNQPGPGLPVSPLEAAGAVLVVANFAMIFAVRGTETTFDNLRTLGWYDAVPQLGAVLFVAGWLSGRSQPPPRIVEPPRLRQLLAATLFAATMLSLQTPRAQRVIFQYDGLAAQVRPDGGTTPDRIRTAADLAERARNQRQALAELDRLEQAARQGGVRGETLRRDARHVSVPGMPPNFPEFDPAALLAIPTAR